MLRRTIAMAAFGLICGSSALADTPAQARKAIAAIYAQEAAAFAKKDPYAVYAHQAVDYVAISKEGERFDKEHMFQNAQQLQEMRQISVTIAIVSFTFKGNKATVRTKNHIRLTKEEPDGKQITTITQDSVSEDLWIKQGKEWLVKQSKEISSKAKTTTGK